MKPVTTITSVHNAKVKSWSQLKERKYRNRSGLFLIEGIHLVQAALRVKMKIEAIVYNIEQGIPDELQSYVQENKEHYVNIEWIAASAAIICKCTDTDTPPPVFAIVQQLVPITWEQLLTAPHSLVVVVDSVQDPGNLGTMIRVADAVGVDGVIIGKGTVDLYNAKTIRATMGSLFHVPIIEADLIQLLPLAKRYRIQLVGTSLQATASCYHYDYRVATWFIVGNEGQGISLDIQPFLDDNIIIPMRGQTESLNVAMATTVLLYEAMRQRYYSPNRND